MKLLVRKLKFRAPFIVPLLAVIGILLIINNFKMYGNIMMIYRYSIKTYAKDDTKIDIEQGHKFILLWSGPTQFPFKYLEEGNSAFRKYNCEFKNCYVTSNRSYFNEDITKFDALAFNGPSLQATDLPTNRLNHQDYIYFNTGPAANHPVCNATFDNFFNMTATYRLDSDLKFHYFDIHYISGEVVGPNINMKWVEGVPQLPSSFDIGNKTKAVAWLVSNCEARNPEMKLAMTLRHALRPHGFTVDTFGCCRKKNCSKINQTKFNLMLSKKYYFYFSAETSFCEDYVSKKVITALANDVIPIVYGGADYFRFLPPHSFIDSRAYSPKDLALLLVKLIRSPKKYQSYFEWKNYYMYKHADRSKQICAVCAAINRKPKTKLVYEQFRKWWYPKYKTRCLQY